MNPDCHDLIQRYLDGISTEAESEQLQELLKNDESAARLYLRYMNLDVALESHAESMEATRELLISSKERERTYGIPWMVRRTLLATAAGIVLGALCTSVVLGFGSLAGTPPTKRLFPLSDGDFERDSGPLPGNPPARFGIWTSEGAEVIPETPELRPRSGRQMLRFARAETDPPSAEGFPIRCDVYQLIDLESIWTQVGEEDEVTLEVRASFLDVHPGPEGSGTFNCRLLVHPGEPEEIRNGWPQSRFGGCAYAKGVLRNGPASRGQWRTAQAKVILPRDARIAAVHLGMIRFTDTAQPQAEFGQCYVDEVSLTVTARPLPPKE